MHKKSSYFILGGLLCTTVLSALALNAPRTSATTPPSTATTTTIRVRSSCSMTATVDTDHERILINGQYGDNIGLTTITTFCNDPNGYAIYAIGYTGGDNGVASNKNTVLHSSVLGNTYDIPTGINTTGNTSSWSMKLSSFSGSGDYAPTILSDDDGSFDDYHIIPSTYTKVANYGSSVDLTTIGSSLTTTYAAYIKPDQPAGNYEGQVKYVLVHPSNSLSPNFNMQNVDEWGSTIAVGEEVTAVDLRDNKSYTVRRMCMSGVRDNCAMEDSMLWMIQNLDLDLDKNIELTSEDTDLNVSGDGAYVDGYSADTYGAISWVPANSTITSINNDNAEFNGWSYSDSMAYSADPDGGDAINSWYISGSTDFDSAVCASNACNYLIGGETASKYFQRTPFATNGSHGKIGNYYNWSAAIASNNSGSLTSSTYDNIANNPQNSICPRGWRLPTISSETTDNEFAILNRVYNSNATNSGWGLINSPVYITRAGNVYNAKLSGAGQTAVYWSSTIYSGQRAYYLYLRTGNVNVSGEYQRGDGRSIRCVSES